MQKSLLVIRSLDSAGSAPRRENSSLFSPNDAQANKPTRAAEPNAGFCLRHQEQNLDLPRGKRLPE